MLDWAMNQNQYPVALRVPGTKVVETGKEFPKDYSDLNAYAVGRRGSDVAIIAAGNFYGLGEQVADGLKSEGIDATLINPRFLSGIDRQLLMELEADHRLVITLEDGVLDGGFGEKIARFYGTSTMNVQCYGIRKEFVDGYDYASVLEDNHLTSPQIVREVMSMLRK